MTNELRARTTRHGSSCPQTTARGWQFLLCPWKKIASIRVQDPDVTLPAAYEGAPSRVMVAGRRAHGSGLRPRHGRTD